MGLRHRVNGHTRTYVVFNPRFGKDPKYGKEFVIRADDNTLLTEINWRDNPWFLILRATKNNAVC